MFLLGKVVFSKQYRKMVADLKKIVRQDLKDEGKMYDFRTSEGSGRKGSADLPASIPKSRQSRRGDAKESRSANREEKTDRDSGAAAPPSGQV